MPYPALPSRNTSYLGNICVTEVLMQNRRSILGCRTSEGIECVLIDTPESNKLSRLCIVKAQLSCLPKYAPDLVGRGYSKYKEPARGTARTLIRTGAGSVWDKHGEKVIN
jgi:hypothetical protein